MWADLCTQWSLALGDLLGEAGEFVPRSEEVVAAVVAVVVVAFDSAGSVGRWRDGGGGASEGVGPGGTNNWDEM